MDKLKNLLLSIIVSFAIATFFSCKCKTKSPVSIDYSAQGYTAATIIDFEVDGCKWMIQFASGEKYEPQNLAEEFKKDQLKVWIKYEIQKKAISICMGGIVIKVVDVKKME